MDLAWLATRPFVRWIDGALIRNDGMAGRHPLQPRVLPDDLALGVAAIVPRARAADLGQCHGIVHAPQSRLVAHVVDLVHAPMYPEDLAAIGFHLGHERQALELSRSVQR